eukprot:scaffold5297_cov104-Cylindrotheca_fusiformis.AAC.5
MTCPGGISVETEVLLPALWQRLLPLRNQWGKTVGLKVIIGKGSQSAGSLFQAVFGRSTVWGILAREQVSGGEHGRINVQLAPTSSSIAIFIMEMTRPHKGIQTSHLPDLFRNHMDRKQLRSNNRSTSMSSGTLASLAWSF